MRNGEEGRQVSSVLVVWLRSKQRQSQMHHRESESWY